MREFENEKEPKRKRRRLKYPGRFIVAIITLVCLIWMIYNFVIALVTGQKFSMLGNSFEAVSNVVVAGVDEGGYRTDLILLCQVDRRKGEINVLQIPRDTKVTNNRNDKKINSAYYSGFECMSREIAQITGIAPDKYIMISFDAFNEVIDAMGGVRVDVPIRMNYTDPVQDLKIDLQPGMQRLNGEQAQMFMRFRQNNNGTGYKNGDTDRLEAQKLLYSAIMKKMISPLGIIKAPAILSAVKKHSVTNLRSNEIFGLMRDVMAVGKDNIRIHTLPGGGRYIGGGSYFVVDKNSTKALMNEYFAVE